MAKIPTYEEMAKKVADRALDEFLYDGKSIREWIKIIAEQEPKTRTARCNGCRFYDQCKAEMNGGE